MDRKKNFINSFLVLFSSNILQLIFGVITSIIIARYLNPEKLGLKTVLSNFPSLFVTFFEMGTRQSTIYFVGQKKYQASDLFSNILSLWLFTSILGLVLYFIVAHFEFQNISIILLIVSASYIPIKIGHSFLSGLLLGKELIRKLATFNIANAILTPFLTILFLMVFDDGVLGVLLAAQLVALYTLFVRIFLLCGDLNLKFVLSFRVGIIKDILLHGIYYAIALFVMTNFTLIPIYLMTGKLSTYEIGIYSVGSAFALLLKQVISSTFPVLFAKGANAADAKEFSRNVHKMLRISIIILILLMGLLYWGVEFILPLVYGNSYFESVKVTQILLLGVFAYVLQYILIMDMAGKGKPQITIKAMIVPFLLCIILNYIAIDKWGNVGAAYSTSFSMFLCCISYLVVYSKEMGFSIREMLAPRYSDWVDLSIRIKSLIKK